jgi:hypothetical protein
MDTSRPYLLPTTSLDPATKLCNRSFDLTKITKILIYGRSGPKSSMRLQRTNFFEILTSDSDPSSNFALNMTSIAFSSNDFCLPGMLPAWSFFAGIWRDSNLGSDSDPIQIRFGSDIHGMEFTYALRVADPRPRGGWPPSGRVWCFQLLLIYNVISEWILIRRRLWGHNDTLFGRPTPGWSISPPGVGHPQGIFECIFLKFRPQIRIPHQISHHT